MRHWTATVAIGAAILSPGSGFAIPPQGVASGIYLRDERRSDNAFAAIDAATADLPTTDRALIRMRLRKSIAVTRMRISVAGKRVGVLYDDKAPIVVWIGEDPVRWKLIEQLVFDVSAETSGGSVSLTFHGADSDRVTTYRSVGDEIVENTVISVPLVSKPIVYDGLFTRLH